MQNVMIKAVLNGWTVQVGCQTLVFINKDQLLKELDAYMLDPKKKEASVRETAINKYLLMEVRPPDAVAQMPSTEGCLTPVANIG